MFAKRPIRRYTFLGLMALMLKAGGAVLFLAGSGYAIKIWFNHDLSAQRHLSSIVQSGVERFVGNPEGAGLLTEVKGATRGLKGGSQTLKAPASATSAGPVSGPPSVAAPCPDKAAIDRREARHRAAIGRILFSPATAVLIVMVLSSVAGFVVFGTGELLSALRQQAINSAITFNIVRSMVMEQEASPPLRRIHAA